MFRIESRDQNYKYNYDWLLNDTNYLVTFSVMKSKWTKGLTFHRYYYELSRSMSRPFI